MCCQSSMIVVAALALATGCADTKRVQLEPASAVNQVPGTNAAAERRADIHFLVQTSPWPGGALIDRKVTPVRISLDNQGRVSIEVRYSEFQLVSPDGRAYSALPPFRVRGEVPDPRPVDGPMQPAFEHDLFKAAPYFAPIYNDVDIYADFTPNIHYYEGHYVYWEQRGLPTKEMISWAVPEGVILPGGHLAGWLYFEKVPHDERQVNLRATFAEPRSGATVAKFEIPFYVTQRPE